MIGSSSPAAPASLNQRGVGLPGCGWVRAKSIERASMRGGVPVFSRRSRKPSAPSAADSSLAGPSPARPPAATVSPAIIRARRKVPVVSTAARQA